MGAVRHAKGTRRLFDDYRVALIVAGAPVSAENLRKRRMSTRASLWVLVIFAATGGRPTLTIAGSFFYRSSRAGET